MRKQEDEVKSGKLIKDNKQWRRNIGRRENEKKVGRYVEDVKWRKR